MSTKPIDTFITNSVQLFEANPSQTIFSIAYKCKHGEGARKPVVSFKTHNPHLSSHYKFKTNKSKDVSRLLSALGPRGVSITRGKVEKKALKSATKKLDKKNRKKAQVKDVVGLGTLMVNTDVKEYVPVVEAAPGQGEATSAKKKKQNKSKGKKKR